VCEGQQTNTSYHDTDIRFMILLESLSKPYHHSSDPVKFIAAGESAVATHKLRSWLQAFKC